MEMLKAPMVLITHDPRITLWDRKLLLHDFNYFIPYSTIVSFATYFIIYGDWNDCIM